MNYQPTAVQRNSVVHSALMLCLDAVALARLRAAAERVYDRAQYLRGMRNRAKALHVDLTVVP